MLIFLDFATDAGTHTNNLKFRGKEVFVTAFFIMFNDERQWLSYQYCYLGRRSYVNGWFFDFGKIRTPRVLREAALYRNKDKKQTITIFLNDSRKYFIFEALR